MSPHSSEARLAANRANAQKSTGPKSPEGKAISALNSLVHGLCAQTIVLPGEDADAFAAFRAALDDDFQPQSVFEHGCLDMMAASRWALNRARRQENAVLARKMAEAHAQYDAQHGAPPLPPEPEPEEVALEDVPWEDRCAVGAARVRQMPEGRALFLERWRFLRGRMVLLDRPTAHLDEMLLMLGHRAGELVQGDPLVEQVTLDWISLWFTHDPPNRHRVGDAIFRCSSLRGIDLENEISRLLPKVPSHQEGLARLLALIDEQIAQLENFTDQNTLPLTKGEWEGVPDGPCPCAQEPPSIPPPEGGKAEMGNALNIDEAAREEACAYALFDGSKEGALRLRYMTAHDLAFNRAFRNLLAYRKQRDKEREGASAAGHDAPVAPESFDTPPSLPQAPSEANYDPPVATSRPSKANAGPPRESSDWPAWVGAAPVEPSLPPYNPPKPHSRQ